MKIALIQFEVKINQKLENVFKKVNNFLKKAKKENCHLACFPEDFLFGPLDYYQKEEIEKILKQEKKMINFFSKKAKQYQISIIAGTIIRKIKNKLYNSCFIFDSQGKIIYLHNKQKLVPFGFENRYIAPGKNQIKTFVVNNIKCGVLICRELFYPELFQKLRRQGIEIIFIPAFWSKRSSDYLNHKLINQYHFLSEMRVVDVLCQARSFENEICLCFVNACGNLKDKNYFDVLLGRTQVCYPFYGCVKKINQNKEGIIIFDYQKSIIEDAKKAYQLFK
ncbi:MAG: carbon-nitrogen hydrolase family protein [Patescibacteria group bacterium]|nr:carbon-nitrogen hydrolase family protein [Patescibacteria group bacterium]